MNPIEEKVIQIIKQFGELNYMLMSNKDFGHVIGQLQQKPFGCSTSMFFENESIKKLQAFLGNQNIAYNSFHFWMLIESYIVNTNPSLEAEKLALIEQAIMRIRQNTFKEDGTGLLPDYINRDLIRKIYSLNNSNLTDLFSKYLPIPRAEVFEDHELPPFIAQREKAIAEAIPKGIAFFKDGPKNVDPIKNIIKWQRIFRASRKQKEEMARFLRISTQQEQYFKDDLSLHQKIWPKDMLSDSKKPYVPQKCSSELAKRIVAAAEKVKFFTTVRHLTASTAIPSILDDCLYGHRALQEHYMSFKKAALSTDELHNGDANAICFGPHDINSDAILFENIVEIVLTLERMSENPCIFFKERDFGWFPMKVRKLVLGNNYQLLFSHTSPRKDTSHYSCLVIYDNENTRTIKAFGFIPNFSLIGYDVQNMHAILTLNFFRFIDNLKNGTGKPYETGEPAEKLIQEIYSNIAQLDDEALMPFLEDVGKKITDTMEFNFYAAYRIDLPSILSLRLKKTGSSEPHFTLHIKGLIEALNAGNQALLLEVKMQMPQLLKSYRFLDYLLSQVKDEESHKALEDLRKDCTVPSSIKALSRSDHATSDPTLLFQKPTTIPELPAVPAPQRRLTPKG